MKIKVVLLMGTNSRNAGGLFNTVKNLAFGLKFIENINVNILSFNDEYSENDKHTYEGLNSSFYKIIGTSNFGYSKELHSSLRQLQPKIIHQQGIWMYLSKAAYDYVKENKDLKLIIEPHGMLDPWAVKNSAWKKKIVGYWFEYKNLKKASCIQALCEPEYQSIRKFGLKNPVAIIPNGIHLPEKQIVKESFKKERKILLFIGRIHPKKGLEILIEALHIINQSSPEILKNWEVRIAGWNQNNHQEYLAEKCKVYKLEQIVNFIGSVYDENKNQELTQADAFILPSFSEGLPMSVLEAWSYKLPVIMTNECNIPEGFNYNAAININHNSKDMSNTLVDFFLMNDNELLQIGNNGYELVKEKYTWGKVAEDTYKMYQWVLGEIEKPDFIHLD